MGREAKRVPIEFDWPMGETWDGYLMPARLRERPCDKCEGGGCSPEGKRLHQLWYGYIPFNPADKGSTPFTAATPAVRAFAERNVGNAPGFYGQGEAAILTEATRLADLFNGSWSHHLAQSEVDLLVADGRLKDFTHTWSRETGWTPIDPPPTVTAAVVNEWSVSGFGHGLVSLHALTLAELKRSGVPLECAACDGHGSCERWPGQRAEAEAWEQVEPPTGEGWQMWETTSEGSPSSPVFATAQELADWCAEGTTIFGRTKADSAQWLKIITGEDFAHVQIAPGVVVM